MEPSLTCLSTVRAKVLTVVQVVTDTEGIHFYRGALRAVSRFQRHTLAATRPTAALSSVEMFWARRR